MKQIHYKECTRCVNSTSNPTIKINRDGLCSVCAEYKKYFDPRKLIREKDELKKLLKLYSNKAMVGISGGKDSTATLYTIKEWGVNALAFSFDTGYYPKHIESRARATAKKLKVPFEAINIKSYLRPSDKKSYQLMADIYDENESATLKNKFIKLYAEGRKHYSVKDTKAFPFVRTCQLCRKIVIRAYYDEALKRGYNILVLGINEWAGLSKSTFTAIRKLKPYKNKPPVYIVHLPFLLQRNINDTKRILKKLNWKEPAKEHLIESNANSCLLALAAEAKAVRMLGFHPDSTRLSREATVGFITKQQAKKALSHIHHYPLTVRKVLQKAKIL